LREAGSGKREAGSGQREAGSGQLAAFPRTRYTNVELMRRPNRTVAGICIAVIAVAAFAPGMFSFDHALFEPLWVLLPDETPVAVHVAVVPCDEQPVPLLSLVSSRAPPSHPLA
jgi:hypothetical protein